MKSGVVMVIAAIGLVSACSAVRSDAIVLAQKFCVEHGGLVSVESVFGGGLAVEVKCQDGTSITIKSIGPRK